MNNVQEFYYKLPGTPGGNKPGAHRSRILGSGLSFAAHKRLFDQPDPRRLDLRASLRDVRRDWLVKANHQNSSLTVHAMVDVSASMHFGGVNTKLAVVCEFIEAMGYSAFRHGDAVSLIGFDSVARDDLYLPPRTNRGAGLTMRDMLTSSNQATARSGSIAGLSECVSRISTRSSLIFIVSDFHWPLDSISTILDQFGQSLVVPMVVWDPAETQPPKTNGWLTVSDAETGRRRSIWLRDSIRKRWLANVEERRAAITDAFAAHDIEPFYIEGAFDPEQLTQHFLDHIL